MVSEQEKIDTINRLGTKEGLERFTKFVNDTWKQIKLKNGLWRDATYYEERIYHAKVKYHSDLYFEGVSKLNFIKSRRMRNEAIRKLVINLYYYKIYTFPTERPDARYLGLGGGPSEAYAKRYWASPPG